MFKKILTLHEMFRDNPDVISVSLNRYSKFDDEPTEVTALVKPEAFFKLLDPTRTLESNGVIVEYAEHCDATFLYLKRGGVLYNTCFSKSGLSMDDLEVLRHAE